MKNLYLLLLIFSLSASAQTGLGISQLNSCDAKVNSFLSTYGIPGATMAIAKDGKLIYMKGFGYHDLAKSDSVQPHHLFRIASVSKPITAIAVMKLVENGQLSLQDTVFGPSGILANHPYLSTANITDQRIFDITVQQLLEHTSGWDRDQKCVTGNATPYTYSPSHCDPIGFPLHVTHTLSEPNPVTEEMHIKFLLEKGLDHTPGTSYHYSNIGYLVLGEIIEEVSGQAYEDYVKSAVLAPINICDMHVGRSLLQDKMEREVEYEGNGYTNLSAFGGGQQVPWEYGGWVLKAMSAHGGWIATARDLVQLVLAVDGFSSKPDILTSGTINQMVTPSVQNQYYAKGWSVNSSSNWWHNGSLDGTASIMVRTSGGYVWALMLNKRVLNSNSFWNDLDNLPWSCISGLSVNPTVDFLAAPSSPPTNLAYSPAQNGELNLSWTSGDGDQRLVVMSDMNSAVAFPLDGNDYQASASFGSGDDLGNGNFVVYNGSGNSVKVDGLIPNAAFRIRIFEYNRNATTGNLALYKHCQATSDTVSVTFGLTENSLAIELAPNPVTEILRVELPEAVTGEMLITDASGQVLRREAWPNQAAAELNLSYLPKGFYIIMLRHEGEVSSAKFLKQ